ncbi:MAG: hypothetical protein PHU06_06885 [Gallionella sp.]|nr:hypothetical protein [Gallionella sp.]MDD4958538.1 hypothetical protein [Gallionella sp.]
MLTLKKITCCTYLALLVATTGTTQAAEFALSGYGTIGFAKSDQNVAYQRHISSAGGFRRDTVFGAQLNTQFNNEWSATIQAKLASSPTVDHALKAAVSWAFVSYRPTDDLLFRVGKLRIPFYLNSESADVGTTFASARLPIEVYGTAATTDFTGASFAKTWTINESELTLDGYWGKANAPWRFYARDPNNQITPTGAAGEFFAPLTIESKGLRLNLQHGEDTYLAGIHYADTRHRHGQSLGPSTFIPAPAAGCAPINIPPAFIGNYNCPAADNLLKISSTTVNFGMSVDLGSGFRTIDEYVRLKNSGSELSPDSTSYYLMLLKEFEQWTPYVSYAKAQTKNRPLYQAVNSATTFVPAVNAYQRMMADLMVVYDQQTWAVGTSYALDHSSKIKAEWSVVKTGVGSSFVDAQPGGQSGNKRINVMSVSYNFIF